MATMIKNESFQKHAIEYEEWYDKNPTVFESELTAIRRMLSNSPSKGLEVGLGSNKFSKALGIKDGIDPLFAKRSNENNNGLHEKNGSGEKIPFEDFYFDFVLMATCISYFYDLKKAFTEANRVLKRDGALIIGFIEKESIVGNFHKENRNKNSFYKFAAFYKTSEIIAQIKEAGFHDFDFFQTFFNGLDENNEKEQTKKYSCYGSCVVIKAKKASF
jgi:SAM-dependent methyltransferase